MYKSKKCIAVILAICLCWSMSAPVFAAKPAPQYNPILEAIGISEEAFCSMSEEKRMFYQDVCAITASSQTTKYYKAVSKLDVQGNRVDNLVEVSEQEYNVGVTAPIQPMSSDQDSTSGGWYSMTTTISEMAVTGGELHYYVANKMTVDQTGMGWPLLDRTGYLGVSLNANMSPVSGSEYLTYNYEYIFDPGTQHTDYDDKAEHKGTGYAFDFGVTSTIQNIEITMTFQAVKNTASVIVFDAYGFAGYWKSVVKPSISVSAGGASLGISPTKDLIKANNTHAQLKI